MRHEVTLLSLVGTIHALVTFTHASLFSPFVSAFDSFSSISTNQTSEEHEFLKRQATSTSCPTSFNSCAGLGAPQLCCASSQVCSADYAGHVACCPTGAACTGTISSVVTTVTTAGVIVTTEYDSAGLLVTTTITSGQSSTTSTTTTSGVAGASATTTASTTATASGFIVESGTSTVASFVSGGQRMAQMVSSCLYTAFDINIANTFD